MKNNSTIVDIKYPFKKIKTTPDYVLLFFDDENIMISIENYFKYNIKSLDGLDDNLYELFKKEEKTIKAYRSCLRKLTRKDYTTKQIRESLYKYELDSKEIDNIVSKLIEYNLLDDNKYCINRINYFNDMNYSYKKIKNKLLNDGISDDLIESNLVYDYDNELNKARKLINKYNRTINNKSVNAKKKSMMNKLVNDGYSYEISKSLIEELKFDNNDNILLEKELNKAYKKYSNKYVDYELKNKIYAYLVNKGFTSSDIKEAMEVLNDETN